MIAMQAQGFAGASEVQLMDQEDLEDIEHALARGEILGLDTPSLGPVIDIQELFLESGGQGVDRFRRRWFYLPAHAVGLYDLGIAEMALEVACKRIDPDAFDGLSMSMQSVEFATALRITEVLPVGGLVAGTGKARLLDEGFEQDRPIGVAGMPVGGQSAAYQGEDARGEIFAVDPRQDQEAGVIDDEVQVALSLICCPTDELIPGLYFPGTRAEAESGDDVACGADEVAKLCAWHELMPEVVMALDICVPQQRVSLAEHQIDAERGEFDGREAAR